MGFNGLMIQSTMNYSSYYDSEEDEAESDPKIDTLVDTHTIDKNKRKISDDYTTKGNSPHKFLTNRKIPAIIKGVIPTVNQTHAGAVASSRKDLHVVNAVLHKSIVTGTMCSAAGVIKDPLLIN